MMQMPLACEHEKKIYGLFFGVMAVCFLVATAATRFNPFAALTEIGGVWAFVADDFLPPVFVYTDGIMKSVVVTIALAVSSAAAGALLAFIAAVFGSEYVAPSPAAARLIRAAATFLRNIPTLVWAFILFSSLGVGTGVGFVALLITSVAFMTRAFIEVIDEVSSDSIECLTAVGATFWQRIFHSVLPNCAAGFIAWFLYCLEVNIRSSTVVGMVGGGGIGMILFSYLKSFKYPQAAGIILLIAAVVILVDLLTNYLRRKVAK